MGGHEHIGVNDVLGILILTGVTIPVLTAMRLYITLRGEKRKRTAATKWGAKVIGEVFLVVVALLSTIQAVLWGWNAVEELMYRAEDGNDEDWAMVPGERYLKRSFWASIWYICHLWTLKGAFLCLYYDLLPTLNEKSRRLVHVATATTLVSLVGILLTQVMWCRPIGRNWSVEDDFCSPITERDWIIAASWVNIGTDLLISFIPLSIISTLKLTPREKYGFITIYLLGFLSIFASFLRFLALYTYTSRHTSRAPEAWIHSLHRVILWSAIEVLVAHICFCIPAFRVFFRRTSNSKKSRVDSTLTSRNIESRNTMRAATPGGENWFDNFSSNPNSPLTGVRRQEPVFPSTFTHAHDRKPAGAWTLVPPRDSVGSSDDDEAGGLVAARDSEDSTHSGEEERAGGSSSRHAAKRGDNAV
ncbi:hypothetical protein L873DRAFT_1142522 [Choiromyces venosus 120613-1]|uniref:Rhodopsin domain-containing protein n=1 Tax=Choiromyces venosus 120613-1 TaxID=1336337 RepID=A0A3N4JKJ9_9PEZI|nr:hypothetical protein L873DRAFT_1142522 [Choiromyces venosus 120613-1]